MRYYRDFGHTMRTDIQTRADGTPLNARHFKLIRGSHSWWWSAILKKLGQSKGGRQYEVIEAFRIEAVVEGEWLGVECEPGYRFDGPTIVDLTDEPQWWNPLSWVYHLLGKRLRWRRTWWLAAAAAHDKPYKNPSLPRNRKAFMLIGGERVPHDDRRGRNPWDKMFRNILWAADESPNLVELAYGVIVAGGTDIWDQFKQ